MQTIQLSEIQCYLSTGLQMINTKSGRIDNLTGLSFDASGFNYIVEGERSQFSEYWPYKPFVIPLSELTKEDFDTMRYSGGTRSVTECIKLITWEIETGIVSIKDFNYLLSRHYDVFDWIGRNLAVNKLEYEKEISKSK